MIHAHLPQDMPPPRLTGMMMVMTILPRGKVGDKDAVALQRRRLGVDFPGTKRKAHAAYTHNTVLF